jgi:hypothetical protein
MPLQCRRLGKQGRASGEAPWQAEPKGGAETSAKFYALSKFEITEPNKRKLISDYDF